MDDINSKPETRNSELDSRFKPQLIRDPVTGQLVDSEDKFQRSANLPLPDKELPAPPPSPAHEKEDSNA